MFPDWLHPNTTPYWIGQFEDFFSPQSGIDIDGVWYVLPEHSILGPDVYS